MVTKAVNGLQRYLGSKVNSEGRWVEMKSQEKVSQGGLLGTHEFYPRLREGTLAEDQVLSGEIISWVLSRLSLKSYIFQTKSIIEQAYTNIGLELKGKVKAL